MIRLSCMFMIIMLTLYLVMLHRRLVTRHLIISGLVKCTTTVLLLIMLFININKIILFYLLALNCIAHTDENFA